MREFHRPPVTATREQNGTAVSWLGERFKMIILTSGRLRLIWLADFYGNVCFNLLRNLLCLFPGISQNSGTLKQSMWFEWIKTDGERRLDSSDPPNKGCLLFATEWEESTCVKNSGENKTKRQREDEKRTRVTSKVWHVFGVSVCWNTLDKTRIWRDTTKIHWNTDFICALG